MRRASSVGANIVRADMESFPVAPAPRAALLGSPPLGSAGRGWMNDGHGSPSG